MLTGVAVAVAQAAFLIALCTGIELAFPRGRIGLRQRVAGVLFALSLPILGVFVAWPLSQAYAALGIGPILSIPLADWLSTLGLAGEVLFILFLVAVVDFLGYWQHRFEHRFFWPVHAVHHSPTELCAANAYGHFLQVVPAILCVGLPLSLFQFHGPEQPLLVGLIVAFQNIFIHAATEINYGPFNTVFVDNRFHRIHHSTKPEHIDRNFGVVFTIWDRVFRTAVHPKEGEWPATGIDRPPPRNFREFLLFPLGFRDDLNLVSPGPHKR